MSKNNTAIRIIFAVIAIPIMLGITIIGGYAFLSAVLVISLISFKEFSDLAIKKDSAINNIVGFISVSGIVLNSYFQYLDFQILLLIILVVLLLWELYRNKNSAIHNTGTSLLGVLYTGLFPGTIIGIREISASVESTYIEGAYIIISVLVAIWVCDSAAFFLGTAFGKNKLFPRISPNKSWEGAAAGFVFSIFTMAVMKFFLVDFLGWQDVIIMGIIVGIIGQLGDLVESLFKRDAKVKDSSSLLPGHGGVLDRIDSILFTAPTVYLYLYFFYL